MKKKIITDFISRYNLGGTVESVKWISDGSTSTLKTSFISEERTASGILSLNGFKLGDAEIGVHDTAKLKSLLSVLGDDIDVDLQKHGEKFISMKVSDGSTFVNFMLADLSVIPNAPTMKKLPDFNLVVPFDRAFSDRFISAKNALPDVDIFTLMENKKKKLELVLGHSSINSNRITLSISPEAGKDKIPAPISFSAKYLKEILSANSEGKDTVANLHVSSQGLARISFQSEIFNADYYLVEVETQD